MSDHGDQSSGVSGAVARGDRTRESVSSREGVLERSSTQRKKRTKIIFSRTGINLRKISLEKPRQTGKNLGLGDDINRGT